MRYITVEDLSFYYDKEPVLEHINYSVDSGEFVTLTGENGAAKTTLIKASLGILQPRFGKVTISKTTTRGTKLRIAYLPHHIASFNAGFPFLVGKSKGLSLHVCLHRIQISLSWMNQRQGWTLVPRMNFTSSCTIVPTIMVRLFS